MVSGTFSMENPPEPESSVAVPDDVTPVTVPVETAPSVKSPRTTKAIPTDVTPVTDPVTLPPDTVQVSDTDSLIKSQLAVYIQ